MDQNYIATQNEKEKRAKESVIVFNSVQLPTGHMALQDREEGKQQRQPQLPGGSEL